MTNYNPLADRYALIKAEAEAWNKKLEAIKAEIKELGQKEIIGVHFTVTLTEAPRTSVSSKLVKEFLSPEDVALVSETVSVQTIRVKASSSLAA